MDNYRSCLHAILYFFVSDTFFRIPRQTNNFLNQAFDIILFDKDDQSGYDCYTKAV